MTITAHGPYEAKIPRTDPPAGGYTTAEQELSTALEGTAPHLAKQLAEILGPYRTVELARVVRRAVAVGINRRADAELADRMQGLYGVLEDGLQKVDPDCVAPDRECACAVLTEDGDCTVCGKHWEPQDDKQTCGQCGDHVHTLSTRGLCDGCEADAACTHSESLYGRCVSCGMTWDQQAAARG